MMEQKQNEPFIGLDFGNYNSFPCYISDWKASEQGREGGKVHDLLPYGCDHGIPSIYFYSQKTGVRCGKTAERCKPVCNRLRYLKRHLWETIEVDGNNVQYDDAVTAVIESVVREANKQLKNSFATVTNQISLSYPATFSCASREHLIELAEKATLEDGRKIKVIGTIAEPAAAALDYLHEQADGNKETTVLVFDLGGGSFDLSLVTAYPAGRKDKDGDIFYYDIENTGGLPKLGGTDFDRIIIDLLRGKIEKELSSQNGKITPVMRNTLLENAEGCKIDLSNSIYQDPQQSLDVEIPYGDEYLYLQLTRKEFEEASKDKVKMMMDEVRAMLKGNISRKPERIILTGGASQMPMIQEALNREFPEFRGKIVSHRVDRAIAYGAARYGVMEKNTDMEFGTAAGSKTKAAAGGSSSADRPRVIKRVPYDIGLHFYENAADEIGYIINYIEAGTPYPFNSEYITSETVEDNQTASRFTVCEAKRQNPDRRKPEDDYTGIMEAIIKHAPGTKKGTENLSRLCLDRNGVLRLEAIEKRNGGLKPVTVEKKLQHLEADNQK